MRPPLITKYCFRIRTRVGLVVENLMIHGRDEAEARSKLRQMYRDCEVLECVCYRGSMGKVSAVPSAASYEQVINFLTR
jgi:hypothetical protein